MSKTESTEGGHRGDGRRFASYGARVLIVEAHELLAQSLTYALRVEGFEVEMASGPTVDDVLVAADRFKPAIVLVDPDLGEGSDRGLHLIDRLRANGRRILLLTATTDHLQVGECIEAGAAGLVSTSASLGDLVAAISKLAETDTLLSARERHEVLTELRRQRALERAWRRAFDSLTPREEEILFALTEGQTASAISECSYVSLATVRSQIRSVLMKLGVRSQLAAVVLVHQTGWSLNSK